MAQIDTLVPATLVDAPLCSASTQWEPRDWTPGCPTSAAAGTLLANVSDADDNTFIRQLPLFGACINDVDHAVVFVTSSHTPPAGHRRHRIRAASRFRADNPTGLATSTAGMRITSNNQILVAKSMTITASICDYQDLFSGWQTPSLTLMPLEAAQVYGLRVWTIANVEGIPQWVEIWAEVDNRAQPALTAEVLNGAGAPSGGGIISDTSIPRLVFRNLDYDGLAPRTWRWAVYTLAQTLAGGFDPFVTTPVDQDSGNGSVPAEAPTDPLPDDDYVGYLQVSSTIRTDSQYDSNIATVAFEIAFTPPDAPDVTTTITPSPPSVEVCWDPTSPAAGPAWDDPDDVVAEVQRSDCGGEFVTVHVAQTGVSGCWDDRFVPLSNEGVFCDEHQDCAVTYRVRYWGLVTTLLVATDWTTDAPLEVDNPTPAFPWLRGPISGDLSICPTEAWGRTRPFGAFQPIGGGIPTVVTGSPGGRDYTLTIPTTSLAELATLEAILAAPLVYYQPPMQADVWLAPITESMTVTKVKRIHEVTVPFVAVLAEPLPTPQSFF